MRRPAVWLIAAALLLALGVRASAQSELSGNDYQIDGDGRYVVIGAILWDKTEGRELYVYHGWYADNATATPRPPVATATPGATDTPVTPPPTLTPSSTPRPPVEATPTPDSAPQPTPPGANDKACRLRTRNVRINERTGPGLSAPRTATSPIDTYSTLKVDEFRVADGYLWAREALGWFAARDMAAGAWWVDGASDSLDCSEVEGWPEGLAPPPPIVRNPRGLHLIYSAPRQAVLDALPTLGTLKATDGAEWALAAAKDSGRDIVTVYRAIYTAWGKLDCPPDWGYGDPVTAADRWYDMLIGVWAARGVLETADLIEYRNECLFVGDWEVAFDRRMVERASASGVCLLLFSDAPGTPEIAQFAQRRPVLDLALKLPCDRGRRHGIAHHIYFGRDSGAWLFGRWQLFRAALGPRYDALAWWFTEYGVPAEDGTVTGRGPADCGAVRAEMGAADATFRAAPEVGGYHAYSVGQSAEWTDIAGCL
ncbi:MAG: hypothetical protein LC121_25565 [Anaerolineae bacterium]|nr:hypothetical protein [Anaerolineae bacterium]